MRERVEVIRLGGRKGKAPDGSVYVGRQGPGLSRSPWANVHKPKKCDRCGVDHTAEKAVELCRHHFLSHPELIAQGVKEIWEPGLDVACWCPLPQNGEVDHCHGRLLLDMMKVVAEANSPPDKRSGPTPRKGRHEDFNQDQNSRLSEGHLAQLVASAIKAEVAREWVCTVEKPNDLPKDAPDYWSRYLPARLYRWQNNGHVEYQLAPDKRDKHKYLFRKDAEVPLNQVRDDGYGPILLVEGTKQHLAAASYAPESFAIYGMDGCWGWTKADPSFARDRKVWVIFDGDLTKNLDVWEAAAGLRDTLKTVKAKVMFVHLPGPGTQGLDDFLAKIGDTAGRTPALLELIDAATPDLGRKPGRKKKAQTSEFFDENGIKPQAIADEIALQHPLMLSAENEVAVWRNGAFRAHKLALVGALVEVLGDDYRRTYYGTVFDAVVHMLDKHNQRLPDHIDRPWMNVVNGMVDLETGDRHDHNPELRSAIQFPIKYDPDATCPRFDAWCEEIIGDQTDALLEVVAVMLDPTWMPTKAALLYGPSRSGKSTFLRLLKAIVGREYTTGVSLHELAEDQFARANLYGKVLNVAADLSARHVHDLTWFKLMTGEDLVRGNRKYGQDFHFTNRALFCFSANELPTVSESSRAYSARIMPFKFAHSFADREDHSIEVAMMQELPGILNRLIEAWRRRKNRGNWLPIDAAVRQEFEEASDRVLLWVREEMRIVTEHKGEPVMPGQSLPPGLCHTPKYLAQKFNEWAKASHQPGMSPGKVKQRLAELDGVVEVRQGGQIRALNITEQDETPFQSSAVSAESAPVPRKG